MEWWSDLWLNEGFATYAGTIGVNHIHPDWKMVSEWEVSGTLKLYVKNVHLISENRAVGGHISSLYASERLTWML